MLRKTPGQKKQTLSSVLQLLCCALVLLLLHGMKYFQYALLERTCVLCESQPCQNLCLVELDKGEVHELPAYDAGEWIGALAVDRDDSPYSASISVPTDAGTLHPFYFCNDCGELLDNDLSVGYMLVDLSDPVVPVVYPLIDGAVYHVRCYEVSITFDAEKSMWDITVFENLMA